MAVRVSPRRTLWIREAAPWGRWAPTAWIASAEGMEGVVSHRRIQWVHEAAPWGHGAPTAWIAIADGMATVGITSRVPAAGRVVPLSLGLAERMSAAESR